MSAAIEAAERLRKFCDEHAQMGGLDPELIIRLHQGHEREAAITVTDLRAMIDLLAVAERACGVLWNAGDVGRHFTCSEAETIKDLIVAAFDEESATVWIMDHAAGDDDDTDLHHDLYLAGREGR